MLQKLNERIQGVVAWVIITLIAVTFALFGIDYYIQSRHASSAAVEIDDESISKQAFELNYRRTRQMRDPKTMTAAIERELKKQVLDDLVINRVSVKAARQYGFGVSPEQAKAAIISIPQFQQDGHFSTERYQQVISGALFTPESFRDEVRQGMLLNQQRFALIGTAFALPNEVERFVKLYMQMRDYRFSILPVSRFIDKSSVSHDEVVSYYKTHQSKFLTSEQVALSFVKLSMNNIQKSIVVSDDLVKQYYDANQNNYLIPARWLVAHIQIAASADASDDVKAKAKAKAEQVSDTLQRSPDRFDEMVKTISDDKVSAVKKGRLPWIVAGQTEFDKALVMMTKPGQISEPIQTRHGYEILKLITYKPAETKPFDRVKQDIKEQLVAEEAQAKYAKMLEQLSDLSYQSPDSLKAVAEELDLTIEHTKPFSKNGGDNPLTQNKSIINAAFSHDVLELDNNSDPIQIDNNSVVVLRVKEHIQPRNKSLNEVKSQIIDILSKEKANVKVKKLAERMQQSIQDETAIRKLMSQYNIRWKIVNAATRETDKAPSPVNEIAFGLPKKGAVSGQYLGNNDYAIVQLTNIKDGQLSELDEEKKISIAQQLEANYGIMAYDLYVKGLLSKANIVRH